jgi:PAS domain S-box-containing protein
VNDSWTRFAADNGETTMARTGEGSNYFKVCERSAAAGDSTALSALAGMKDVLEGRSGMFNLEYPCHAPNELRWFNMRVTKFENNQSMIVVAHENISERKLAEENLLKNEFHLKEAQSIALLGNWSTDFATGKGIWSEEACRIYGIDTAENVQTNKNWLSFVHPDDLQGVLDSIRETKETLSNPTLYYRIVLKNGTMKHIQSKSKFEFNSQGQPTGMYGIIMDITERKQTEDEREKMIVNIVEHSKKLEQFTFIVSHNLRSPVAHILGLANVMKTSITEEDRLRSQEYLFTATRQLDEIMQDLNMILQLRSSDGDYDEVIKLESLVDGIMKGLGNFPEKDSVQVITDFTAVKEITAIKSYMYSIFLNLISNSIKYRKPESPSIIHIRTSLQKNRVIISFRDNGIGINLAKHSGDIFGLYKRFHFHVKGKGLGLFMVRTQVESLGGTIRIDSMEGEGTGFTIEIPA